MPKPSKTQKAAANSLKRLDPNVELIWNEKTGAPVRIRGNLSMPQSGTPDSIALQFLKANRVLFAIKTPEKEFILKNVSTDAQGNKHIRYNQVYKGLPVFGSDLVVHITNENVVRGVNGKYTPRINLSIEPKITNKKATEIMVKHAPDNKTRPGSEPILLILVHKNKARLAWHMTLGGKDLSLNGSEMPALWAYFVDAQNGQVIWRYNNLQTHGRTTGTGTGRYAGNITINTLHNHTSSRWELEDQWLPSTTHIKTHDADGWIDPLFPWSASCPNEPVSEDDNNNWSATDQGAEVDCHMYTRMVFDYFLIMHGRDSYDDSGADMHIHAHVGSNFNNAFWNGNCVQIGDGDGADYDSFCTLDIIAHEWTHAVTEHTANLTYSGESGALNESMSDVFAALIDGDWLQGEDNWLGTTAPAGRNLADPTNGNQYDPANPIDSVLAGHQPDHYSDRYTGLQDGGGVHINSGIMNKAAYLIATGGTHRHIMICEGLGREVLGRLYYHALANYLTSSSDFDDMRTAVLDSLTDLYDGDPRSKRWQASINNAFAAVGVGTSVFCPKSCWVAPRFCPPDPSIFCPPSPLGCPPSPTLICPPSPTLTCPPSPTLTCPPSPILTCPPSPGGAGCLPGPDPIPFQPKITQRKRKVIPRKQKNRRVK